MSLDQEIIQRGMEKLKARREGVAVGLMEMSDYDEDMLVALAHSQKDTALYNCIMFRDALMDAAESGDLEQQRKTLDSLDDVAVIFDQAREALAGDQAEALISTIQTLYTDLEKAVSVHDAQTVHPTVAAAAPVSPTSAADEQQPPQALQEAPTHAAAVAPPLSKQESKFVGLLAKYWGDVDPQDELFRIGLSGLKDVTASRKENRLELVMREGSPLTWMREIIPDGGGEREFIGVGGPPSAAAKFTAVMAEDIVKVAQMRGWASVKVHGTPDNQAQLWLAAVKAGLEVENYRPRPQDLKAFEDWQAAQPRLEGAAPAPAAQEQPKAQAAPAAVNKGKQSAKAAKKSHAPK